MTRPVAFTVVRTIAGLTRLRNSADGNPRWRVSFTNGDSANTSPNADIGYGIGNSEYQGVPIAFVLNEQNQITHAYPIASWADAYGVWHVRVDSSMANPRMAAIHALRDELKPRERGLATYVWQNPVRAPEHDTDTTIVYREGIA